ncbi:hypothetical protein [Bacteroides sp.]|uniref:hypothetical protein n=1 Tax=Bacteroides sp. TaxID=29523 RepID=UPI00260EA3C2|nr:hypothetical protein [Bacteroides sp.]
MKHQASSYRVGPHIFSIINNTKIDIADTLPSLSPFVLPITSDAATIFELHLTNAEGTGITEEQDTDICFDWEDARCAIRPLENTAHIINITPWNSEITYSMECADGFRRCTAYLPTNENTAKDLPKQRGTIGFGLNNFLMMLYAFNAARHHTLLMHASVIASDNKGYLFLGKSGTGKSTHTSLWLKHIPGCHLLNDDNPIVHVDIPGKQVTVYGSPWSGKTPCYRNEYMPVGAFVRLEQAPMNEIKKESTVRAFAALLPSCSCLKQDNEIYREIVSTVTDLAALAPTFHLKCLPNQEAAELCQKTVEEEMPRVVK